LNKLDNGLNNENSRSKNFMKKNRNSIFFLILLTAIVSLITYYRILIQFDIGPVSDSVVFLSNALVFAGQGTGYSDLLRPPFFSFLISLIFRIGMVYTSTIFILDGVLFIFGVIGLFLLFKMKFNDLESFLGGLLYATFPIILIVLGIGLSDLPSLSFSIWAIYLSVLAVKKDSRFFILAFPFLMFAFLTRYNTALLIFPIFLFILMNRDKINFRNIIAGLTVSILIILPVLLFFYQKFGSIIYPFLNFASSSTSLISESTYYNPNIFFFLQNLPAYIGIQGFLILIIILGFVFYFIIKFMGKNRVNKNLFNDLSIDLPTKIKLILIIFLGVIFLASFGSIFYMASELLFFALAYLIYDVSKNKLNDMDIHLLFLAWFMAFFIFHSIFVIKDNRYFVLMAPPLAYFMILGLSEISKRIKVKIRNRNITFPIFALIFTSIILLSTASQIPHILEVNTDDVIFNEQLVLASQWFVNNESNYRNKNIYSDLWPNFSWYLKTNVKQVPVFKNNQTFHYGVGNSTFNQDDSNAFNNFLETNHADYYFSVYKLNLTSYTIIKRFGFITIYKKN
jgi:4-amino-4-deoxy-L-arabinose transferase-like glycosyltransferase